MGILHRKQSFGESTRQSNAPFVKRLLNGNEEALINDKGQRETHLMSSSDNLIFPMIQKIDGQLVKFDDWREALDAAIDNNNIIEATNKRLAKWYAKKLQAVLSWS